MYLFGEVVEWIFKNHVMNHPGFEGFKKKVKICRRIDHYAGSNPRFLKFAPVQLGLAAPTETVKRYPALMGD